MLGNIIISIMLGLLMYVIVGPLVSRFTQKAKGNGTPKAKGIISQIQ